MIKAGVEAGQVISASAKKITGNSSGLNQEGEENGFVGEHEYTVLDVEEREIRLEGGTLYTCKFIKVRNPWGQRAVKFVSIVYYARYKI